MAKYPDSTKTSLEQRLRARARERWPQIASLQIRHRGNFSYADAALADGTTLKLCRLRYVGSASQWQFAIYRASHDDYDESVFPTGLPVGTCQDALDTACGLYLNDPTAWIQPPTNLRAALSLADQRAEQPGIPQQMHISEEVLADVDLRGAATQGIKALQALLSRVHRGPSRDAWLHPAEGTQHSEARPVPTRQNSRFWMSATSRTVVVDGVPNGGIARGYQSAGQPLGSPGLT